MSFYGNVTYYLSNAFKQIIYENTATNSTTVPTSNSTDGAQYQMTPGSQYDSTKLMAGNTWIRFGRDQKDEPKNQCYIFHKLTGLGDNKSFSVQAATGTPDLEPAFGSIFTIPQITFDAAGHLSSGKEVKVKLPVNPGVEDIDAVKRRLAILEELVTGDHGDSGGGNSGGESGGGEGDIPDVIIPYATQIQDINTKINDWNMYFHKDSQAADWIYREGNGIGTTLHEVMVVLGMRKKKENAILVEGEYKDGYMVIDNTNLMTEAPDSVLAKVTSAQAISVNTSVIVDLVKKGIRDVLQYLVNAHIIDEGDRDNLIRSYFQETIN